MIEHDLQGFFCQEFHLSGNIAVSLTLQLVEMSGAYKATVQELKEKTPFYECSIGVPHCSIWALFYLEFIFIIYHTYLFRS